MGDTEELNSEGHEKKRRQWESRVNSGVEKKSPVANIDTKKTMHMFGMVEEQRQYERHITMSRARACDKMLLSARLDPT